MRRPWLLPFAPLYWLITSARNSLFDLGILRERSFDVPILGIGNLSTGGTGKTPHTEWVLEKFQDKYRMAVVSRGYGRKTKGYLQADESSTFQDIGDEPLQIYQKFPNVQVVVCEKRVLAIKTLLAQKNKPEFIILDDSFQHRYVAPGLRWLLTPWNDPYTKDFILPLGNLREDIRGADRADLITVTKGPGAPTPLERAEWRKELNPTDVQTLGFSRMHYSHLVDAMNNPVDRPERAVVVTGIAEPEPLIKHLTDMGTECIHVAFTDHRQFTYADAQRIVNATEALDKPVIITTRKDFVRWPNSDDLNAIPTIIQDIEIEMDNDDGVFYRIIDRFVADFHS